MFTPDAIKRQEPHARAICNRLIDRFAGSGGCDAAVDYAQEIPARVIAHMLGLPDDEGDLFRRWIHEMLEVGITEPAVLMRAIGETTKYFHAEIEKRRAAPTDDLISYLANAKIDGQPLAEDHLLGTPAPAADRRHRHHLERDRGVLLASRAARRKTAGGSRPSRS